MPFADWIKDFHHVQVWPGLSANVLTGKHGQAGFFQATETVDVPEHAHQGQWGVVLDGTVELTIGGVHHTFTRGDQYNIPAGVPHSARVHQGAMFIDVWEGRRLEVTE